MKNILMAFLRGFFSSLFATNEDAAAKETFEHKWWRREMFFSQFHDDDN